MWAGSFRILWNPKVHYRVHNSLKIYSNLKHTNPVKVKVKAMFTL